MSKIANVIWRSTQRNLKAAAIAVAVACAVVPMSSAMAQSHGGRGVGVRGGAGGFRGGFGGFHGYGRPGFGFYFGGPYFGWPYYYGTPYGYPYPYGYYSPYAYSYPNLGDGYSYPPQQPVGSAAAPESYWYYCDDPKGYYPYIATCNGQWREVSPTPVPPRPSASQSSPGQ